MTFGLFFILTAWLIPNLPLWFSIILTVFGGLRFIAHLLGWFGAVVNTNNS